MDFGRLRIAWSAAVVAFLPIAFGYLKYSSAYGLRRWPLEIQSFSADVASVLKASGNLRLWGWLNVVDRPESALFPGLALITILTVGIVLAWSTAARGNMQRLRATRILLAGAIVFGLLPLPRSARPGRRFVRHPAAVGADAAQPFSVAVLLAVIAFVLHPSIRAGWGRRSPLAFYTFAQSRCGCSASGGAHPDGQPSLYKAPYAG